MDLISPPSSFNMNHSISGITQYEWYGFSTMKMKLLLFYQNICYIWLHNETKIMIVTLQVRSFSLWKTCKMLIYNAMDWLCGFCNILIFVLHEKLINMKTIANYYNETKTTKNIILTKTRHPTTVFALFKKKEKLLHFSLKTLKGHLRN